MLYSVGIANVRASHRDHSFTVREREETYFNYGE